MTADHRPPVPRHFAPPGQAADRKSLAVSKKNLTFSAVFRILVSSIFPSLTTMKKRTILSVIMIFSGLMAFAQRESIVLTFTAENNGVYVQLSSIKVMNRTQDCDTVLYYPDTSLLVLYYAAIPEINPASGTFRVFQNYPNPAADRTTIAVFVPERDNVSILVSDLLGRIILQQDQVLDKGTHYYVMNTGKGNPVFFTASWRGQNSTIKILQAKTHSASKVSVEYLGNESSDKPLKELADIQSFSFSIGDTMLLIGYADGLQSGILDTPEESATYTFQFATNIPCPGTPTVEYEGQIYNTIQIFSQCWLKENLNVGTMIDGVIDQSNNGTIEKYCMINEPDTCTKYGGLYQWNEMMQYTTQQGVQGICPPGWHLPADEEWKVLEGAVDSQYGIGDNTWDYWEWRGFNAGTNLKTTSGWNENGNGTDLFGFSALPGGNRTIHGDFYTPGYIGYWWTSKQMDYSHAVSRSPGCLDQRVYRASNPKEAGFSVRCLRDE
jgi:uncharacterized protein (TIGR02145 family)